MAKNGKSATTQTKKGFSKNVLYNIGYYVYALIDPRDGKIFYIGKGEGNRMFSHVNNSIKQKGKNNQYDPLKIKRINDIKKSGKDVSYLIIRHGLTSEHALYIESVLIDLFNSNIDLNVGSAGLTNLISGIEPEKGILTFDEIESKYSQQPLIIQPNEKILAININSKPRRPIDIYKRVRGDWVLNPNRANKADYIIATHKGRIIGVYKNKGNWYASKNNPGRYCFNGTIIRKKAIIDKFIDKYVPTRQRGSQNPIYYINGWK